MRCVDRYVTYYKIKNSCLIDIITFDKFNNSFDLQVNVDVAYLGSEDINGNFFKEIELPKFLFDIAKIGILKKFKKDKIARDLSLYHLVCKSNKEYLELILERKTKKYILCKGGACGDNKILIDYAMLIKVLEGIKILGYKDITSLAMEG